MIAHNLAQARHNMVEQQIRPWEVFDRRVLELLREIPREAFVPENYRGLAYAETAIPLGHGDRMMTPTVEARLLQALQLSPSDDILEIGTGSGFLTACLARLGHRVVSIDLHPEYTEQARQRLEQFAIDNVTLLTGNGLDELPTEGHFDAIAITASLPALPEELIQRLSVGGRLFVVTGQRPAMTARLVTRVGDDQWSTETLFETDLEPLTQKAAAKSFQF
jgi:protein-L-isoaspartate(D-aspartate) O-methyltransferase